MATPVREQIFVNGFDTTALSGLARVLSEHPEGGRVTFLSRSKWQDGARVSNSVRGYRIDGEMHHQDERYFVVHVDEPREFGAADSASAPVEHLMYALGSCIAATTNAYASLRGIRLSRLEVAVESDVDLHGMFGLDDQVRPGLNQVRVAVAIAGEASDDILREVAALGVKFSPVRDSIEGGVALEPTITVAT